MEIATLDELLALPVKSVVLDVQDNAWQSSEYDPSLWFMAGSEIEKTASGLLEDWRSAPLRLIHKAGPPPASAVDVVVARHLAEAGAVHPKVHTPNRVMQWLGEHGWQAVAPVDPERLTSPWAHCSTDYRAFVPLHPDTVDYPARAREVAARGAQFAGVPLERALLEIALLPDEVAW